MESTRSTNGGTAGRTFEVGWWGGSAAQSGEERLEGWTRSRRWGVAPPERNHTTCTCSHMHTFTHARAPASILPYPPVLAPLRHAASLVPRPCEEFLQLKFRFFPVESSFYLAPWSQCSSRNVKNVRVSPIYKYGSAVICGGKLFVELIFGVVCCCVQETCTFHLYIF